MDRDRHARVDMLVALALEHAPGAREALLDEACGGDAELRREVESLPGEQAGERCAR